ncbi:MAG: hypothetical protein ABJE95_18735 [Byssovorax sp.]
MRRVQSFVAASVLGLLGASVLGSGAAGCSGGAILPPPLPDAGTTSSAGGGQSTGETSSATTGTGGDGGGGGGPVLPTGLTAKVTSRRFLTADHMLASIEMQISGEPFAELLGRDLGGYDRFSSTPDVYVDPATSVAMPDLLGFATAVESYEYSKQSMNNLSFEAGAGLSLQFGPLLNPGGAEGDAAYAILGPRLQYFAKASRASGAKIGKDFVTVPPPANDLNNAYGWAGFWPVFAEFRSFDPSIKAKAGADQLCSLAGAIDEPAPPGTTTQYVGDYECDSTTLNLTDRDAQVDKVLELDALGLAAWKQTLWTINYWGSLHDVDQHPIVKVPGVSIPDVGIPGNTVIGQWPDPLDPTGMGLVYGKDGSFFGDVSLEGWQGLVMIEEIDNKSALMLKGLTTTDGSKISGVATVKDAVDYDYTSPVRWWPGSIAVTEKATGTPAEARKFFPKPTSFTVQDKASRLQDITAVLGGFGTVFAMTDSLNAEVGGSQAFLATFDGVPFAADNGLPDGEDSLHDRSLGILKMALVNLDRLHFNTKSKVLTDTADPVAKTQGNTVSTLHTSYSILGLRTAIRGLNASLTLYSNDTPDAIGQPIPLDQTKLTGAPFSGTLGARVIDLIKAQGDFLADKLVGADGLAANGWDLAAGKADPSPTTLESQSSAIRGLLEAYLATSNEHYRQRASEAYAALEKKFWMADVHLYRTTLGESSTMKYTPVGFGATHGALRQFWKLVANKPGQETLAAQVLSRITSGMKLVVNGWNDVNGDGIVQPKECIGAGLQMAERALTGEFSIVTDNGDRDHDCVPDIATAGVSAALAAELVITRK